MWYSAPAPGTRRSCASERDRASTRTCRGSPLWVKCRPPHNRDPLNTEQDACIGYLRNQVALIRPKVIICLGRISAIRLIKPDFKITKEHGQWFEKSGVHMTALFHPAAILRDPSRRPDTFVDLKGIQAKIREVCTHTYR